MHSICGGWGNIGFWYFAEAYQWHSLRKCHAEHVFSKQKIVYVLWRRKKHIFLEEFNWRGAESAKSNARQPNHFSLEGKASTWKKLSVPYKAKCLLRGFTVPPQKYKKLIILFNWFHGHVWSGVDSLNGACCPGVWLAVLMVAPRKLFYFIFFNFKMSAFCRWNIKVP